MTPKTRNICTFAVLFFKILFCQSNLFHIVAAVKGCMHGYCVLGKSLFLSRAALFDCGLANWSCMSRSVKGDMLVSMVSAVKMIP